MSEPAQPVTPAADNGRPEQGDWQARIAQLAQLEGRPLAEHADAYDTLHADLKRRLGQVDTH